jgi:hypothetical protein
VTDAGKETLRAALPRCEISPFLGWPMVTPCS